ncbi:MAG: sugar phosphate isomerase/epimerase family protein [Candidatus Omnitrophota bacterium]
MVSNQTIKIGSGLVPFSNVSDRFLPGGYREAMDFEEQLKAASKVKGLDGIGLDYPLQFDDPKKMKRKLEEYGLKLCTLEVGIYGKKEWKLGAFTSPDAKARQGAIDTVKKGIDAAEILDVEDILLWFGQDGFDYPFQVNYTSNWNYLIEGIREIAEYGKDIKISIEYKLKEPRLRCHISTVGNVLYVIEKVGLSNVGAVIDLGHSLLAQENPAESVSLLAGNKKLFQVHVNDNYCDWDSDLLVGSINLWTTVEFFYWLRKVNYKGWYIMDFFPYRENGVAALIQCIEKTRKLYEIAGRLGNTDIPKLQKEHDAVEIYKLLWSEIIK